jgi:hypothetical protein
VKTPLGPVDIRELLHDATGEEAQLALSYLLWPDECPDPRLVDEWVRREQGYAAAASEIGAPTAAAS